MATHLYGLCQAADLRAMEFIFRKDFFPILKTETLARFTGLVTVIDDKFLGALIDRTIVLLNDTADKDSAPRFDYIMTTLTSTLIGLFGSQTPPAEVSLAEIELWRSTLSVKALDSYAKAWDSYRPGPDSLAAELLGKTSALYKFVRGELGVLIHWGDPEKDTTEIGTEIGKIFRAFDGPRMIDVLLEVLRGRHTFTSDPKVLLN